MKSPLLHLTTCLATLVAGTSLAGEPQTLERREILDGRVSILVPKELAPAPERELKLKYPGSNRPAFVLEDESGSFNIVFDVKDIEVTPEDIPDLNDALVEQFKARTPAVTWVSSGPITIDGNPYASLDLYSQAIDTEMRNIIVATSLDGRLLLVSVNYPREKDESWESISKAAISSISITRK